MKRILPVVVALVAAGCLSPSPAPGGGDAGVHLRVELSRDRTSPGDVLHGNATVTNSGDAAVRHYGYCDPVIVLRFLGPDGRDVHVAEPRERCEAFSVETLGPGESGSVPFTFDGRLWDGDRPEPAPSGRYTAVATFRHWPDDPAREPLDVPQETEEVDASASWAHDAGAASPVLVEVAATPVSGRPGEPVAVVASATNAGDRGVTYDANACSGLRLRFFAPDGREVFLAKPRACTRELRPTTLPPGGTLRADATFDGTLYDDAARPAEAGTYRVEAVLGWWEEDDEEAPGDARADATFAWSTGSGGIRAAPPEVNVTAAPAEFGQGGEVVLNATVVNQGDRPVWYNGICEPSVRVTVERDGGSVQHEEPVFACQAISLVPLGPGERVSFETRWDGGRWESGTREDAESGEYVVRATFRHWSADDAGGAFETANATTMVRLLA